MAIFSLIILIYHNILAANVIAKVIKPINICMGINTKNICILGMSRAIIPAPKLSNKPITIYGEDILTAIKKLSATILVI